MHRNGKPPKAHVVAPEFQAIAPETYAGALETYAAAPESQAIAPETYAAAPETYAAAPEAPAAASPRRKRAADRRVTSYPTQGTAAARLAAAQVAIASALTDPALAAALAGRGYDAARLMEGQALRDRAHAAVHRRHVLVAAQLAATEARDAARARVAAIYAGHVAVARVDLRGDRAAARALDLAERKGTQAAWLDQAQRFYDNALADGGIMAKLAAYGLTQAELVEAQGRLGALTFAVVTQEQRQAEARGARQERDAALGALDRWMRDFTAIARAALAHPAPVAG